MEEHTLDDWEELKTPQTWGEAFLEAGVMVAIIMLGICALCHTVGFFQHWPVAQEAWHWLTRNT